MNRFAFPPAFILLILPFVWRWLLPAVKGLHGDALKIPFISALEKISIKNGSLWQIGSAAGNGYSRFFWLLYCIWGLLVIAAARPQWVGEPVRLPNESRDIMLVLDISTSMLAEDFSYNNRRLNRLNAVKLTASEFTRKRANDRIGLILFGTRAYLQAPLTFDKQSVEQILWSMEAGMAGDSTSIGDALGLALKTLTQSSETPTKNQVIILLTDGENNDGSLSLPQAIRLAEAEKIKIYTIGVGSQNSYFSLFSGIVPGIDEKGLKAVAAAAGGQYFRADNTATLQKIYDLIDRLEADPRQNQFVRKIKELFYIPLLAAVLMALALELAMRRIN